MKTIYIDVETTGLDHNTDQIIEIAAVFENSITGQKLIFHEYQKLPEDKSIPKFIVELTGITDEKLKNCGLCHEQFFVEFTDFLNVCINPYDKKDKAIFAAYNAKFDNAFMRELFLRNEHKYFGSYFYSCSLDIMSTVALAKQYEVLPHTPDHKNTTVAHSLGISIGDAHNAHNDIIASRKIQRELMKRIIEKEGL